MRPMRDLNHAVKLSDKHLQAIGEVAVRWAELEDTLSTIIWDIANLRLPGAYAITTHLNERTKIDICNSLADIIFGSRPLAEELRTHLNYILNTVYPKRNTVVHSTWGYSPEPEKSEILPIKARGKIKFGPRQSFSADDIFAIADEIYTANDTLYHLREQILELLKTLNNWKAS